MGRTLVRFVLGAALVGMTATVTMAQTTTQTKKFEVIAVEGNDLVVKLPRRGSTGIFGRMEKVT